VCHGTLTPTRSSSSQRTSRSGRPCRSTRLLRSQAAAMVAPVSSETEVVLGGGKEYTAVEVTRPHCSRQSRRSHCFRRRGGPTAPTVRRSRRSHYSTEARAAARGDPATAFDHVYLDGRRRAGPDLGPTCPDLGSNFFYLKKRFWMSAGNNRYKNDLFLYPKNSIGWVY
jgi:hypothetical protein